MSCSGLLTAKRVRKSSAVIFLFGWLLLDDDIQTYRYLCSSRTAIPTGRGSHIVSFPFRRAATRGDDDELFVVV